VWLRNQEEAAMWASIDDLGPDIRAKIFADLVSQHTSQYTWIQYTTLITTQYKPTIC
jgi:hypothetical protein